MADKERSQTYYRSMSLFQARYHALKSLKTNSKKVTTAQGVVVWGGEYRILQESLC